MFLTRLTPAVVLCLAASGSQAPAATQVARTEAHPAYQRAASIFDRDYPRFIQDVVALTQIPAPPFKEGPRGAAYMAMLREAGLTNVERDAAGNVMGLHRGAGGPLLVVAAHLDTVFPEGTDVTVRHEGSRLCAPGVGDNSSSLALLAAIARALHDANAETLSDILFVGTTGEEGAGDLRGVRYLFTTGRYRNRIRRFVAVDGVGDGGAITSSAIGSRRYRVTFRGPGGHSYGAFGLVNPAYALTNAVQKIASLEVPSSPRTTFNVGAIGGGTSINAIPTEAWMDVDLRSEAAHELATLEAAVLHAANEAADEENAARSTSEGRIRVDLKLVGSRPSGRTAATESIVEIAVQATRTMGVNPTLGSSSTDANIPMSLGIPAIAIDSGMRGGRAHAPDEWIDVDRHESFGGMARALLLVTSLAGLR